MAASALPLDLVPNTIAGSSTDITVTVARNPGLVLLDREKFNAWYEKLAAKAPQDADVSTRKGREALRSFAAEVRSEKAAIDKARLQMTKEWRDMVDQANAAGKEIKEQLESLAVTVRAPLTEWEEAEKARIASCQADIEAMRRARVITEDDTVATVRERGTEVFNQVIDPERYGDLAEEAQAAKDDAIAILKAALVRLQQEEADRAELARLRAEAEARAEADRLAAEKAEEERREAARQEAERIAAEQAEQRRKEAEEAEAARVEQARKDAAEAAQREAERAAEEERQRIQREHEEALAAERRRAEEAERAARAERERIEAERAAAEAEAKRIADEQAQREKDQAHRSAVMKAVKEAIMTCGTDEETAKKIVLLIRSGEVPNVTLRF